MLWERGRMCSERGREREREKGLTQQLFPGCKSPRARDFRRALAAYLEEDNEGDDLEGRFGESDDDMVRRGGGKEKRAMPSVVLAY